LTKNRWGREDRERNKESSYQKGEFFRVKKGVNPNLKGPGGRDSVEARSITPKGTRENSQHNHEDADANSLGEAKSPIIFPITQWCGERRLGAKKKGRRWLNGKPKTRKGGK